MEKAQMMVYTIGWALGKSFLFVDGAQEYKKKKTVHCRLDLGATSVMISFTRRVFFLFSVF